MLSAAGQDAYIHGFGTNLLSGMNMGWVLSKLAFEIVKRPAEQTKFTVQTWVKDYTALTSTRCFKVYDENEECVANAVSVWCLIDFGSRKLAPISSIAEHVTGMTTVAEDPCSLPIKLRPFEGEVCAKHKIKYVDIDFNKHMNTLRYIDLMLDELPLEVVTGENPIRFDIHFLRESVYGQELELARKVIEDENKYKFAIKKDDGNLAILAQFQVL